MAHFPVNHPARPLYRVLSGLIGLYILVFGVWGVFQTWGDGLFSRESNTALGLRTNLAFSLVSVVFGAFLLIGASRRGNLGHYMNLTAGAVFLVTAILMMSVLQTSANFLNFSMSTVLVSLVFGLVLLATGLYDKVGTDEHAAEERRRREHPIAEANR
ncbi:DUF4383 domain-containing protein [Micromonospora chaiyaphumensis]|uniref:DUF4383 domain-containing protein n=1 Tax=Micromonospora chaiyaphumensis TaxID=307119 RepID=A0A1C4VFH1_9ACTN|nr:DUF4383 domain-containing protein [Micromonospora chaiyaphumensis]SCE82778.1 protein of unknown function [Micromonospora chaiyaphumensis]